MHSFLIKAVLTASIALLLPVHLPEASAATLRGHSSKIFDLPVITSVRGRVVKVRVPAGFESITLERRAVKHRLPVPLGTQATNGSEQELTFRLRTAVPLRLLQVSGIRLPSYMENGRLTEFLGELPGYAPQAVPLDGGITLNSSSAVAQNTASLTLANNGFSTTTSAASASREVLESDIWKKKGDRLYFFNQYRGLQIIDVQDPADPSLVGEVYLPGSGMNLYPLGDHHVVLLTSKSSNFTWNHEPIQLAHGEVLICDASQHPPKIVARQPYAGTLLESRLVGNSLYVGSKVYAPETMQYTVQVKGFDLRNPKQPIARNTVELPPKLGYGYYHADAIQANDHYFLVSRDSYAANSTTLYQESQVTLIDISAPDATVVKRGTVAVEGNVDDKFKIQEHKGVLTVIAWGLYQKGGSLRYGTQLTNFNVSNPDVPQPLGSLELGLDENLYGTRFDGDRAYIVTFRRIDPLWIVDNSNPAAPAITGHVEVPGFSTYLEPLGDRLVTMGKIDNKPTVSLFDVSDPAAPKSLSQVTLTQNYRSSEALYNEKAFTVLPEDGLVMVPLTDNWNYDANSPSSTLQLLDLERDTLKMRGRIPQARGVRRSTVHRGSVLALGDSSLLTADISNRDQPVVLADLDLAGRVDRLWRQGSYLLQLGGSIHSRDQVLSVAPLDAPAQILNTLALKNDDIVAAELHEGYLYVLRNVTDPLANSLLAQPVTWHAELEVFNVGSLPQIVRESSLSLNLNLPVNIGQAKFLFPKPGTMVLTTSVNFYGGSVPFPVIHSVTPEEGQMRLFLAGEQPASSFTLATTSNFAPITSSPIFHLFAPTSRDLMTFDVSQPKAVKMLGTKRIQPPLASSMSDAFAAEGKIFFTHYNGWNFRPIIVSSDEAKRQAANNDPDANLLGRHFLNVVDFTDPANPGVRPPASAPGTLRGINGDGSVFYSLGPNYRNNGKPISDSWVLHASAYTGQKVALIDTFDVKDRSAAAVLAGDRVFVIGRHWGTPPSGLELKARLIDLVNERLILLGEAPFPTTFARTLDHYLLGINYTGNSYSALAALDFANPRELRFLGYHAIASYTADLQNLVSDAQNGFFFAAQTYGLMHIPSPASRQPAP